jgi:hypothetical protein
MISCEPPFCPRSTQFTPAALMFLVILCCTVSSFPSHSLRSSLGISSEAVRLRLMAAIVALRKQVSAGRPVSPTPLPLSAADANNMQQCRDLPYLQLQTQPGGTLPRQRDISSFFHTPSASSNNDNTHEYGNALILCKTINSRCMYARVFVSWPHSTSAPCSAHAGGVPVGHCVPGSRFTVDFFKREVRPRE